MPPVRLNDFLVWVEPANTVQTAPVYTGWVCTQRLDYFQQSENSCLRSVPSLLVTGETASLLALALILTFTQVLYLAYHSLVFS